MTCPKLQSESVGGGEAGGRVCFCFILFHDPAPHTGLDKDEGPRKRL